MIQWIPGRLVFSVKFHWAVNRFWTGLSLRNGTALKIQSVQWKYSIMKTDVPVSDQSSILNPRADAGLRHCRCTFDVDVATLRYSRSHFIRFLQQCPMHAFSQAESKNNMEAKQSEMRVYCVLEQLYWELLVCWVLQSSVLFVWNAYGQTLGVWRAWDFQK